MAEYNLNEVPYFDYSSFFKDNDRVYIHLSTEFPQYVGVMHRHQFVEIVYILSGEAIHTVGNRQYKVKSGDVTVINCGVPHKFTADTESGEPFVAYDLMFAPDYFDASSINMGAFESLKNSFLFYSLFPSDASAYPDMHISGKRYGFYGELFTRIYHEFKGKEKGYVEIIRAYVIELIIKLFRDLEKDGGMELSSDNKKAVYNAIHYIENNYNTKLSVDDIASKVFLSPDYFRKLFKKVTGESVIAYQHKVRVDEACRLLSVTDMSIKDVSIIIGYQDIKAFYQVFKKMVGKTPKEYRNNQ